MKLRSIPEPLVAHRQAATRATPQLACPDCDRRFPRTQLARYQLHWRVAHDPQGVKCRD